MPLFVRAGSIVPMGPAIQHTAEGRGGAITLHVYTGADGEFSLYEDDGVSRQYLSGAFARVPIRWHEAAGTLTIGRREGSFPGMAERREIRVSWNRPGRPRPLELDGRVDETVTYDGRQRVLTLRR